MRKIILLIAVASISVTVTGCGVPPAPTAVNLVIVHDRPVDNEYAAIDEAMRGMLRPSYIPKGSNLGFQQFEDSSNSPVDCPPNDVASRIPDYYQAASGSGRTTPACVEALDGARHWVLSQPPRARNILIIVSKMSPEYGDAMPPNQEEKDRFDAIRLYNWPGARASDKNLEVYLVGVPYKNQAALRQAWRPHLRAEPRFFDPHHHLSASDFGLAHSFPQ